MLLDFLPHAVSFVFVVNSNDAGGIHEDKVKKGKQTDFTDEYNRFMKVLEATIEKNKNKRVDFYYIFLKDFINNAERGVLTRLNMLEKTDEEQKQIITRNIAEIHELQNQCKKASKELVKYKTEIISILAGKLYTYLHSDDGREEILNPLGKKKIIVVVFLPIGLLFSVALGSEHRLEIANGLYKQCRDHFSMSSLKDDFEKSFGVEYGRAIERVFDESFPNVIESLFDTNQYLLDNNQAIKQAEESLKRLEKNPANPDSN
ncbi:unnamed protein product [Mytilus edulis]|uniref:Uncharacterized protein n=1 Tax=Mytilus edulis TaxID=6550 RepID=A0A8S3RQ07_MYTED|nr:unnamed protein product [Mytilus edulis]